MRVIVVGLDGATWNLIRPWADSGELPTFKKLIENGTWGYLESTIPPVTGPAWVSFATGKNPGKHGIFDFAYIENGRLKLHTSKDIKARPFYEFLSKKGLKNIIISLPLSYPPIGEFNGIMISDFLYPSVDIFPSSKRHYIKNFKVISDLTKTSREEILEEIIRTLRNRIKLAQTLFLNEKWDFYFVWIGETDNVSHRFWKDLTGDGPLKEKAKEVFKISDEFLKWILNNVRDDDILIVVSDHGFGHYPYVTHLNKLLKEKGYLTTTLRDLSSNETVSKRIFEHGNKFGYIKLPKVLYRIMTSSPVRPISRRLYKLLFKNKKIGISEFVDFQNSKAFVLTSESWGIYLNINDPQEREKIRNELINTLNKLEFNNKKIFKQVFKREEIYSGPFVNFAPDILFLTNGFFVDATVSADKLIEPLKPASTHELIGIFLAYGPGIKKGQRIDARIYDIAPTILHIFGLPVPNDMDGRVLIEIFEEDSEFAKREPKYVDPSYYEKKQEDETLKRAIRNLKLKGKI